MDKKINIKPFLDDAGKIKQLPQKQKARVAVLGYLAEKFETNSIYPEKAVNALCMQWHTFNDYLILRREMVDSGLLYRKPDGSHYWKPEQH